jgi:flagellar hook-associated protein 2
MRDAVNGQVKVNGTTVSTADNKVSSGGLQADILALGTTTIEVTDQSNPNPSYVEKTTAEIEADKAKALEAFTKEANDFVTSYNNISSKLKGAQQKGDRLDVETLPFRLDSKLRETMNRVSGNSESRLDLGFSISKEGVLSLDSNKFKDKIRNDSDIFNRIVKEGFGKSVFEFSKGVNLEGGAIKSRLDQLDAAQRSINKQQGREEDRITRLEKLYRRQFSGLDSVLAKLQGVGASFSQFAAGLNRQ